MYHYLQDRNGYGIYIRVDHAIFIYVKWKRWSLIWYSLASICTCKYCTCHFTIQIKICTEYWDMIHRPRLVCQEPELRPIGPGVHDESSRGLGNMAQYSAYILICFIAYMFPLFHSSVGLFGNFVGLPSCTEPSAIVHCNKNEAGHQTIKAPSMPCWCAAGPWKHYLEFMPQDWWNWQIKRIKSVINTSTNWMWDILHICE